MTDDLNPDARRLVNLARMARTPGEADKLRIAERLAVPLAASAAISGATAAAKAAGTKAAGASLFASLGVKVAALVAVGVAATALVVTQLGSHPEPTTPRPAPGPGPQVVAPVLPSAEPSPISPENLPEVVEPAPSKAVPGPSAPHVAKADELMEEAALLHQAQAAWRAGQSSEALKLASQHAQRFPHSQLANERDVLRVLSLCKLGQQAAAKRVGARLLKTAKGSPWYQSVANSCAGE
jgi:hypothetical protein